MKNRVAKLVKIGKIELLEEEIPQLKDEEVLVRIKSVGICGSDMHYFLEGGLGSFKQQLPMYMGHEPSGVIMDYKGSVGFKKGDRVAIEPGRPCLYCTWCLRGKHNLCENGKFMGANSQGAFSDYVVVHKSQLAIIPESISFDVGSLMEPLGVGLHAANLAKPSPHASATIMGAGPIGLCLFFVLKKFGIEEIYMVDKIASRVKFAKKIGATKAFKFEDSIMGVKKATNNRGTQYVFDTGGTQESIDACGDLVGMSGIISLVGIPREDFLKYNPHKLRTKEVAIQNVRRSNQTLLDCIKIFSKEKKLESLITHRFPLNDIQKAFELVGKYKDNVIKCVVFND